MLATLVFYVLSCLLLTSAIMVVGARNPVHAVLFLVFCFFNAAWLFLLLGAEFLAFILVIVYAGAVAVLLLFVIMMLDLHRQGDAPLSYRTRAGGIVVGAAMAVQLVLMALAWRAGPALAGSERLAQQTDNTKALGRVLYTDYAFPFQVAGLILLVAMIGAVVLALRDHHALRTQKAADQVARRPEDVLDIVKVETGKGAL